MSMEFYLAAVLAADSVEALNRVIEEAAYDETLTNREYETIYSAAYEKVRRPA